MRQIIDVQRNDEVLQFFFFGYDLREVQFLERAVLGPACDLGTSVRQAGSPPGYGAGLGAPRLR